VTFMLDLWYDVSGVHLGLDNVAIVAEVSADVVEKALNSFVTTNPTHPHGPACLPNCPCYFLLVMGQLCQFSKYFIIFHVLLYLPPIVVVLHKRVSKGRGGRQGNNVTGRARATRKGSEDLGMRTGDHPVRGKLMNPGVAGKPLGNATEPLQPPRLSVPAAYALQLDPRAA